MTALERAEEDIGRGEYWLARRRLESYLQSKGYAPEILARLGEVSHEMKDTYAAGRAWLLSTAEGEHVEAVIETFVKHAGADAEQVTSALYRCAWPKDITACDAIVRERVERFGLTEAIGRGPRNKRLKEAKARWVELFMFLGIGLFVMFCLASCAVGATQIISWTFGG